jgi:chaperone modulatory protein CbpM
MKKLDILIVADYSETTLFDAQTMCKLSHCSLESLALFMQYDIIRPVSHSDHHHWLFDTQGLAKLKMALRLQHDFDLNVSGLALVMDLITEREGLLERNAMLERHLFGK